MKPAKDVISAINSHQNKTLKETLEKNPDQALGHTQQGASLLSFAAYCRNREAVEMIRKYRSDIDIFEACAIGEVETVRSLADRDPGLINSFSRDGFTPLGLACYFGHESIVTLALSMKADPDLAANNELKTAPIHSACAIGNIPIVKALIARGADVNARQMEDITPLHSAAHNGSVELVKLLLMHGADPQAKTATGYKPADYAREKGHQEVLKILKE